MRELSVDTGLVSYNINGVCEVKFNPTDSSFCQRLYDAFVELDKHQEKYKEAVERTEGAKEVFDLVEKMDAEMRAIVNGVFGTDVCGPVFGTMNVYAKAGGLPVWANLFLSVIDEIDASFEREGQETSARFAKYVEKYKKK